MTERLRQAVAVDALASPKVRDRLDKHGARAVGSTPEAFAAFIKPEHARWKTSLRLQIFRSTERYEFRSTGTLVAPRFSGIDTWSSRSCSRWVNSGGNSSR
jgi:hypothetical protein